MKTLRTTMRLLAVAALMSACAEAGPDDVGPPPDDPAVFLPTGAKADGFALTTADYEGQAILRVANTLSEADLDDAVALDRRAAENIAATRAANGEFTTLMDLDDVAYVGQRAFGKMLAYAEAQGWVGRCGDGIVQANEDCDGTEGCPATCVTADDTGDETGGPTGVFVHGVEGGTYAALGLLRAANELDFDTLDIDVGLDIRAARGIVADRPFATLAELDAASYVGASAFEDLGAYAAAHDLLPFCGDGALQAGLEACDDGNDRDGDGCSSRCLVDADTGTGDDGGLDTPLVNGVHEGSYAAHGILAVANGASLETLDDVVGLDVRAAKGIAHTRDAMGDFADLATLDAVAYVGVSAFEDLLAYAELNGLVPRCGDGVVQPAEEACDGTAGCSADCAVTYTCGDGVVEAGETCDDGNLDDDDGCSALCAIEWLGEGVDHQNGSRAGAVDIGSYRFLSATVRSEGDRDYWAFTLDRPTRVRLDVWAGSGDNCAWFSFPNPAGGYDSDIFGPELTLRGAHDDVLFRFDSNCGRRDADDADLDVSLAPGTYYVRVEGQDVGWGWDSSYTVGYRVEVDRVAMGPVCGNGHVEDGEACDDGNTTSDDGCSQACTVEAFVESEPNDDRDHGANVGTFRHIVGDITAGDVDYYQVQVAEGGSLSAVVDAGFDGYLELYGPDGDLLAEDDDDGAGYAPALFAAADGLTNLPGGWYALAVRHADARLEGGRYTLDLTVE